MTLTLINFRDPDYAPEQEHENQIDVPCFDCGGEGGFEHITGYSWFDGSPTGWWEECPSCQGRRGGFIDVQPITLEDLDELAALIDD